MQAEHAPTPPEAVEAEVLVCFQLADEPAPRGRLGRVDWLLLSALSRLVVRGKFVADRGASLLLASAGKLRADWVLVMGLGRQAELTLTGLYRLSYQTAETLLKLRHTRIALDLPLRGLPAEPPIRLRRAFMEGFMAELRRGNPETAFQVTVLPPESGAGWPEEPKSVKKTRRH